jgi:hypothetical protein
LPSRRSRQRRRHRGRSCPLWLGQVPQRVLKFCGAPTLSKEKFPYNDVWPYLHQMINAFTPDRLFWGSDTRAASIRALQRVVVLQRCPQLLRDTNELSAGKGEDASGAIHGATLAEGAGTTQPSAGLRARLTYGIEARISALHRDRNRMDRCRCLQLGLALASPSAYGMTRFLEHRSPNHPRRRLKPSFEVTLSRMVPAAPRGTGIPVCQAQCG